MVDQESCEHVWAPTGGYERFTLNLHMSREPTMHVTCDECGARTWFTESQWRALPRADDKDAN